MSALIPRVYQQSCKAINDLGANGKLKFYDMRSASKVFDEMSERVCDIHSKSLKVIVAGLEHRFCQQCIRFHGFPKLDGKNRRCRKQLADHNARRRKPH
ncbi:squamosa promoter-binding-like protein 12 [Tanacetum coccineum]